MALARVLRSALFIAFPVIRPLAEHRERKPVILDWQGEDEWLNPRSSTDSLRALLVPFAADQMEAYSVTPCVNNAKNQGRSASSRWK